MYILNIYSYRIRSPLRNIHFGHPIELDEAVATTTKIDAFEGADLLDWVGSRFTDPKSKIEYLVEDAGTSAMMGEYFELRTQEGQLGKIQTDKFRDMVAGIPIPDD